MSRNTQHVSPHHYCAICGWESDLSNMVMQNGALVDKTHAGCYDNGHYIGEREKQIAQVLDKTDKELQPHPLLVDSTAAQKEDDISF